MTPQQKASASIALVLAVLVAGLTLTPREETGRGGLASAPGAGAARRQVVAGLGIVEPQAGTADLAALMPGVLAKVHVREGARVRQGEVLAELVNDDLKAKVAQAEAVLAIKTAQLSLVETGPRQEEIVRAEAQLREEESNLKLLQLQFERRQALARAGAVSAEALNTAANALAAGKERRTAVLQALTILRKGSRPDEVKAARGEVKLAQNQLAEAQATLAKSLVRASRDGIVLRRYREPGEALSTQPAVAVIQIADVSQLVVRTQIDENDIADLVVGQSAQISAVALNGRSLTGRVERISPRLGAKTVTADSPTEKRDARVLDVIVALPPNTDLPINLRVDVVIDLTSGARSPAAGLRGALAGDDPATAGAALAAAEDGPATTASIEPAAAEPSLRQSELRQSELRTD